MKNFCQKNFWLTKFLANKNFSAKKKFCQKSVWSNKNVWSKKFWTKFFLIRPMVDKKEIWAKNMSVRQNYLVKKNFGREKSGMM